MPPHYTLGFCSEQHFADPQEMWGEALLWSGDKEDAQKQFARAAQLDLSVADRARLAVATHR